MNDIPEPEISPAFTLEDIRKIRDWNCERRKVLPPDVLREERRKGAERFLALVDSKIDPEIVTKVRRRLAEESDDERHT